MAKPSGPTRPRGRPKSPEVDAALIAAALEEFSARGLHGLTMEAIAARAQVSKVSLYRRWPSREAVVAELLVHLAETRVPEDRGSLEADVRALVEATLEVPDASASARLVLRTMTELADTPRLLALYRTHLLEPRTAQLRTVVERARARGELKPTVTAEVAAGLIAGPLLLYQVTLLAGVKTAPPRDLATQLTRAILGGIGASRVRAR
jgi:AcrR family transcriptional regulator